MSAVAQRDVIKAIVQAGLPTLTSQLSAHERHALLKFRLPNVPEPQNPQHAHDLERIALPLAWHQLQAAELRAIVQSRFMEEVAKRKRCMPYSTRQDLAKLQHVAEKLPFDHVWFGSKL